MRGVMRENGDPGDCSVGGRERTVDAPLEVRTEDPPVEGSFPHPRADVRLSGHASGSSDSGDGAEYWWTDVGAEPSHSGVGKLVAPVVVGDYCYVSGWRLYALDRTDGTLVWCADPGPGELTSPAVSDGTVVVGSRSDGGRSWRGVAAFDAETGERLWRASSRQRSGPAVGLPETAPTVDGGTVYVAGGTEPRTVTALDLETGGVEWQTDGMGAGSRLTSVAVDGDGVFALLGNQLVQLKGASGDPIWAVDAGDSVCPPVVADGAVYAPSPRGGIGKWDAADGTRRWTDDRFDGELAALAVAGGTLYAVSRGTVLALDARERTIAWKRDTVEFDRDVDDGGPGYVIFRACTVTDDRVYLSAGEGLAALDADDGSIDWYVRLPDESRADALAPGAPGVPAVAGGVAYCYTLTGTVHALAA